jgi:outer membrane lipoprotein-sorting protein
MKKTIGLFFTALLFCSWSGRAEDMKLDDVLAAYYKATGLEKMKDWQTITFTGKSIAQGMEIPVKIVIKRPGMIRVEAEVQGSKMLTGFDGKQGWSITPWSGSSDPQDMTADEIKGMKEQADPEGILYNWKEKGHKAELLGKEDVEGTSAYKIKLTKADGDVETYFIDAETFLPLKISTVVKIQGNETEGEAILSNYQEVHGVMMARTVTNKYKGQVSQVVQLETTEINLPVSDSLFMKPAKK